MARPKSDSGVPPFSELLIPTLRAVKELGGSGTVDEITNKVCELEEFPESILNIPHGEDGRRTKVEYRLAWSRTYLKKYGLLENSDRGVWALTNADIDIEKLNPSDIVKSVREQNRSNHSSVSVQEEKEYVVDIELEEERNEEVWKDNLLDVLYNIKPAAFERLAQRLLRESGFFQVEVTGKTGDGGIDGKGIARIHGLLSFHVIFQCKRYSGAVTPKEMREFRGAMVGREVKGLFITTGTFSKKAIDEAARDGAPPIDLIDGNLLCDKLKELKLGVDTKITETVEIRSDWFSNL